MMRKVLGSLALLLALLQAACTGMPLRDTGGSADDVDDLAEPRDDRPGDLYAKMGQGYLQEGQPSVALRKLKRGLEVDPNNARIHAVLGALYDSLGESDAAENHYLRTIQLAPRNPYYRNAVGSFLCKRERYAEAEEHFQAALHNPLYTTPWAANTNAGICAYRAGQVSQAETYLQKALTANPQVPQALLKLAQIRFDQGNYAGAKEYLDRYQGVAPPAPEGLWLAIRIERGLGNHKVAARYQAELKKRFPDAPENQLAKGSTSP